ncbi:hypothetical protein PG995_004647 [Apiospora arundinis]
MVTHPAPSDLPDPLVRTHARRIQGVGAFGNLLAPPLQCSQSNAAAAVETEPRTDEEAQPKQDLERQLKAPRESSSNGNRSYAANVPHALDLSMSTKDSLSMSK